MIGKAVLFSQITIHSIFKKNLRKIDNKLILSCMQQPDFHVWAEKSLPITGQPGGTDSQDSHISFCTHYTQTFECGGGDRRTIVQKAQYRSFGMCVLHFK